MDQVGDTVVTYAAQDLTLHGEHVTCVEEDGFVYFEFWRDDPMRKTRVKADEYLAVLLDLRAKPRDVKKEMVKLTDYQRQQLGIFKEERHDVPVDREQHE